MAEAIQKKKLGPGQSIPGCNSFFLCKYLKDTMLQVIGRKALQKTYFIDSYE
jgi:hypothetical protein